MPTISVIVPVYKVEPYLRRCVDSILNQTFSDFELILVDDGSPDGCPAICDEYAQKDSRVVVIHQENGGLSAARNAGIDWAFANSDSQWLHFVDSDDWIHPQMLEALLSAAEQNGLDVSITSFQRLTDDSEADHVSFDPGCVEIWDTEELFCRKNVEATVAWGKLYRKELFRELRYPVGKIHEDEFLTYRVIFQRSQVAYIPQALYRYYQNENGIMRHKNLKQLCHCCEANREQVWFYHQHQYRRLRDYAARQLLYHGRLAVKRVKKDKDLSLVKQQRNALKQDLHLLQTEIGIPLYGNEYVYEAAMPRRAALSRAWRHFKRDVRKLLSNGR